MVNKIFLFLGLALLGIYIVCVMYPYHFGGYGDLPKPGEGLELTTNVPGYTRILVFAIFSYLFSYKIIGITVLVLSIFCIFIGSRTKSKVIHFGFTTVAVLITLFAAVNMNNYEIINFVLE